MYGVDDHNHTQTVEYSISPELLVLLGPAIPGSRIRFPLLQFYLL